ncbi:MAG: insulinase family protein [Niabella sp.]
MKKISYFIFLVFFTGAIQFNVYAQYNWAQATSGGYTYRYVTNDPMKARFYTLKNGLSVILSPNKVSPRISVQIAVRTGSNNDPKDHTGLAHYLEHLLFKGTDQYGTLNWEKEKPLLDQIDELYEQYNGTTDADKRRAIYKQIDAVSHEASKFSIANEYDNMMRAIGSQGTNAYTSFEQTVYVENIPSNVLDRFLSIQAERFRNPVIRLFHTELEAVYEEKNRGLDNDGNKIQEAILSAVFPTHNYGAQTTIGTIDHLKNPSIKAIREYYHKYYVPNNMAILMAGDFNPDEAIAKVDQYFGYMESHPVAEYQGPTEAPINGPVTKEVYGPSAETVRIAFRSARSGSKEAMLADLAGSILSNGKAGLIDINLNKQQKVLNAGAGLMQNKDYGIFVLQGAPRQGQTLEDVRTILLSQVQLLKDGKFDASLIKAIAANEKLRLLQGLDNNNARLTNLVDEFIKTKGAGWDKNAAYIDDMSRISKEEVVAFANTFFGDKNYAVIYKRKGEDKNVSKVEKPPISEVEINAGKASPFVKSVLETKYPAIKPVWVDYQKDMQQSKLGKSAVLYVQNKDNAIFRLTYWFDMGSWNNKLLPVALQYLQFIGTKKYTAEEISKKFYDLACSYNLSAGAEQTSVTVSGLQENFTQAVALLEEILATCQPDETALENLKQSMLRARLNMKSNKSAIVEAQRYYALYGPKNPYNNALTDEQLNSIKAEDLINILHSLTGYEHSISYYGPDALPGFLTKIGQMHKIPATWNKTIPPVKFERTKQTANQVLFSNYDAVQADIYWARNIDIYKPQNEALTNLFNDYFGGGMGSIVFKTIRESKALAYSTYALVVSPTRKDDQLSFIAYVGCQADKLNEAVDGMNDLLNHLPQNDQSFANSQQNLLKSIETDRITPDRIIFSYLNAKRKGIEYDIRKEVYQKYGSFKFSDIAAYHDKELSNKTYTYCIVGSDAKISMDDLRKYGVVKVLTPEELFGF